MNSAPSPSNHESEITALGRALAVERRARYIDFRGKRSTFSQFMRQTAAKLCKRYPMDPRWSTIRGMFTQYGNLDVASRISIVRRTEELLFVDDEEREKQRQTSFNDGGGPHQIYRSEILRETVADGGAPEVLLPNPSPHSVYRATRPPQPAASVNPAPAAETELPGPPAGFVDINYGDRTEETIPARTASRQSGATGTIYGGGGKRLVDAGNHSRGNTPVVRPSASAAQGEPKSERFSYDAAAASEPILPPKSDDSAPPPPVRPEKTKKQSQDPTAVEVKFVKGVGPKMSELFERLGIHTAGDLIRHYPRHHLDFANRMLIRDLRPAQEVTIFGTIRQVSAFQSKKGNVSILSIVISDGTGSVLVSRFIGGRSNKYLLERYKSQYPKGAQVLASGIVEKDRFTSRMVLKSAEIEILTELGDANAEMASLNTNRLVPVYPLTEGLGLRYLRSVIHNALEAFDGAIDDPLPRELKLRLNLLGLKEALWGIHFPEDMETKDEARRRLVFDELFAIQLQLAHKRWQLANTEAALSFQVPQTGLIQSFREGLPFKLTNAQERVFKEIAFDLASSKPMHRLVQGDVGSGKTVVAAMSALIAIENGYQAAVMAPTEILAEQHFRQFQKWMTPLGLRCALFIGKQGTKERRAMQQALLSGQVHVAVGTHALIQDDVEFNKLGLIIIDEQHRFGVKQRAKLKAKGYNPELLTMTATPIPRTLALTVHGDLDVSEIDELPPGRKPIKTKVFTPSDKRHIHGFIKEEVLKGRQAYIVFPLIEESESLSAKAATAEFETLRKEIFPELSLGLMHGKLKPQEKDAVMEQFRKGEHQILVCTTVIEVGVDVPNASVMVIENADRFGLAQLHQLRGRVGRGAEQSYCFLVAAGGSETTRQRLEIMEKTNDGFVVAEKDLELRGPGEFLGTRQSGMPDLVLADLVNDATILEDARNAALDLIKEDPQLERYPSLQKVIKKKVESEAAELMQSG